MKSPTVLVTGASGRIGQAIVRALHHRHCTVRAHYFSSPQSLHALQQSPSLSLHQADLRDRDQVKVLFQETSPLNAVIHCAAIAGDGLVARTTAGQWRDVMQLNLNGTFYLLQQALQQLPAGGRIIVMGSRVGEHGNAGQAAYAASKAALTALAQTAAREAAALHIAVNVLCPPFVPSAMGDDSNQQRQSQLLFQHQNAQDAINAICSAVVWLLADEAQFITGQVIHPDGRIGFGVQEQAPALQNTLKYNL